MSKHFDFVHVAKRPRIDKLVETVFEKKPCVEIERALLVTEAYQKYEDMSTEMKRAKTFAHVLENMPIVIRDNELIVGNTTKQAHAASLFPEYSLQWVIDEFDTIPTRSGDPYDISDEVKKQILEIAPFWKGKTISERALSYMTPEARLAFDKAVFDVGSYTFWGIGMVCADYEGVIKKGVRSYIDSAKKELETCVATDPKTMKKKELLNGMILTCEAMIAFAHRFAALADEKAAKETGIRKDELLRVAANCRRVPEFAARDFWEANQSLWFLQLAIQIESNGHSISPLRYDQYMYSYYMDDLNSGKLDKESALELMDCLWVKFNENNKLRNGGGSKAFGGYPMFQNINVGGQTPDGHDATNELSFACIEATEHLSLPAPSLAVRVWAGTPDEFLMKATECARMGFGMPAFYNDEVIVPGLMNRGMTIADARNYGIVGCVEPSCPGKTNGWHGAAFFNMLKPLNYVFTNGMDGDAQVGLRTGELDEFKTFEDFYAAYERQMKYAVSLQTIANNADDMAQIERGPLPFLSTFVEDCMHRGLDWSEGGAIYNYTAPQGVGVANVADSLEVVKQLVYDRKAYTLQQLAQALKDNFENDDYSQLLADIAAVPKYGNEYEEVDQFAKLAGALYCDEVEKYTNCRGGIFEPGLYPVSANVPLGEATGASADGRKSGAALADGISPSQGMDTHGPTAALNSCAVLDQAKASNGTLVNQKFAPSAVKGESGLAKLGALIRGYFDQKGMHLQFNIIDKETLLDAQAHPNQYRNLVVRVAGYSAHFTALDRHIQDDIINRTEQAFN